MTFEEWWDAQTFDISDTCREIARVAYAAGAASTRPAMGGEALDALLRDLAAFVEPFAEPQASYGHFPGGDPRKFHPDEESSTEAERAQWSADCEAWGRGEGVDRGGPHEPLIDPATGARIGHITKSGYGLGTYEFSDPDAVALLARIRAAQQGTGR